MALTAVGVKTQIWNNQIKSALLLLGFPLLLLGMLYLFVFLVAILQPDYYYNISPSQAGIKAVSQYWLYAISLVAIWYFFAAFFHQSIIDRLTGSQPISRKDNEKLYNLVENLCISRGLHIPMIYVIETEALNAYASGMSPISHAITVTRGLMNSLNDQELEAVLAHELTHIMNKDVSLILIGIIFTGVLTLLCEVLYNVLYYTPRSARFYSDGGSSNKNSKNLWWLLLIGLLVLFVGKLLSIALQLALSRKREFLADAGAVELTKNPDAMISALMKISKNAGLPNMSGDIMQLCIAEPKNSFAAWFSTHPSIEERVEVLQIMGGKIHGSSC